MGTTTTSVVPSAASSARASLTSGSSHGVAGGPLRDWYTSRQGGASTPARRAAPATAVFATTRCWAAYIPGSPDSGIGHIGSGPVSYTHLRAHETGRNLVCRLLLEKKKTQ